MRIKRVIATILSTVICFAMILPLASYSSFTSYAEEYDSSYDEEIYKFVIDIWNELVNGVSTPLEGTNEKLKEIDEVKKTVNEVKENTDVNVKDTKAIDQITSVPEAASSVTSEMWNAVIAILVNTDSSTGTFIKMKDGSNKYSYFGVDPTNSKFKFIINALKIFAYSIVLVFFASNLIEQSIKYEIFTMKGMLRIFGRLLISKLIIDLSVNICMGVLGALGQVTTKVLISSGTDVVSKFKPTVKLSTSNIKIVGPIIDSVISVALTALLMIVIGSVFIMVLLVLVKLILRSFELTMLVCTSPVFFACASSDITKEYFKKFIISFIQVASQTLFMAIALYVGMAQISTSVSSVTITQLSDIGKWYSAINPVWIIMLAMCVMMIKPPKVLTNLLK